MVGVLTNFDHWIRFYGAVYVVYVCMMYSYVWGEWRRFWSQISIEIRDQSPGFVPGGPGLRFGAREYTSLSGSFQCDQSVDLPTFACGGLILYISD